MAQSGVTYTYIQWHWSLSMHWWSRWISILVVLAKTHKENMYLFYISHCRPIHACSSAPVMNQVHPITINLGHRLLVALFW